MDLVVQRGNHLAPVTRSEVRAAPRTGHRGRFDRAQRFSQRDIHPLAEIGGGRDVLPRRGGLEAIGMRERADRKQAVAQVQQGDQRLAHDEAEWR